MRLPSVDVLIRSARRAAERFPLVLLAGAVSAFAASCLAEDVRDPEVFVRLMLVGTLGIPLFVALGLYAERWGWAGRRRAIVWSAGFVLLAVFFLVSAGWSEAVQGRRYVQLSVAFHLLVAFLPFVGRPEANGFWQFNRTLLERILLAAVYTLTLYAGVALAVGALDRLLGVPVPDTMYAHMWFVAAFVFSTWVFLAGVPADFAALEARTDYPKDLKKFAQYVLMPLVVVYLAILTLYLAKIVITTEWPSGWIGYLVSSVAVVGMLSVLLIHPLAEREAARWVTTYVRWFYVGLLPALAMLLLAIWKRIDQYGVTENRYFMVVLALWLAGIAIYYSVTRSRNLKPIPMTLCLLALVTVAGPWSAYAVSRRSQVGRLQQLFEANGMWRDGRVEPAGDRAVSTGDRREMAAGLEYLATTHGTGAVDDWFTAPVATDPVRRGDSERRTRTALNSLGLEYVEPRAGRAGFVGYVATGPAHFPVTGYERSIVITGGRSVPDTIVTDGYTVVIDSLPPRILAWREGVRPLALALDTLAVHLGAVAGDTIRPPVIVRAESDSMRVAVIVWEFDGVRRDTVFVLRGLRGQVLMGR